MNSNIMVDGVLASCYAFSDNHLTHIGITPLRLFPAIMDLMFGVDSESPGYIKIVENLSTWMFPHNVLL